MRARHFTPERRFEVDPLTKFGGQIRHGQSSFATRGTRSSQDDVLLEQTLFSTCMSTDVAQDLAQF